MAAAREEKMTVGFHHNCHRNITLTDNNTTAEAVGLGTVFSFVPLQQLLNNRFAFRVNKVTPGYPSICYIGVTRSDPGDQEKIPDNAIDIPKHWCVHADKGLRYENSREVNTKVAEVTQYKGDVWTVEVAPGGRVYIHHNYNQPWGSPVFTLSPDTTQLWVAVTLLKSTISVIQDNAASFLHTSGLDQSVKEQQICDTTYHAEIITPEGSGSLRMAYQTIVEFSKEIHTSAELLGNKLDETVVLGVLKNICKYINIEQLKHLELNEMLVRLLESISSRLSVEQLDLCVSLGLPLTVQELLRYNETEVNEFPNSLLHFVKNMSAQHHQDTIRELLLDDCADVNIKGADGDSALLYCVKNMSTQHHKDVIRALLMHRDIDVNIRGTDGDSPLLYCVKHISTQHHRDVIIALLFHHDIDVNIRGTDGDSPLLYCVKHISSENHQDILTALLIHHDIDVNSKDRHGYSLLYDIIQNMSKRQGNMLTEFEYIDSLLQRPELDLSCTDDMGRSLADVLMQFNDTSEWDVAKRLLEKISSHPLWTGRQSQTVALRGPCQHQDEMNINQLVSSRRLNTCDECNPAAIVIQKEMSLSTWVTTIDALIVRWGHFGRTNAYDREETSETSGIGRVNICTQCTARNKQAYLLAETFVLELQDVLQKRCPPLKINVLAMGSYIQDLKVLDTDEFDFLLVLERSVAEQQDICDSAITFGTDWFVRKSQEAQGTPTTENPSIISVYRHGPAWCLEIAWIIDGQEITISVDITFAVRHEGSPMKNYCEHLKGHRYFDNVYQNITEDALFVNLGPKKDGLTRCTVMMKMMARLSYNLPYISTIIRVVKALTSFLFPKSLTYCEMKETKLEVKSYFSSHTINTCVLKYMDANIDIDDFWVKERLAEHVGNVFNALKEKILLVEDDYFPSKEFEAELGTFLYIQDFLKRDSWQYETDNEDSHELQDCFAVAKVRTYAKIRSKKELTDLCRPPTLSMELPTVVAYIIPENPLLQTQSKQKHLAELMCHFRSYLINKFKDLPVRQTTPYRTS